ncbi:hypothetical protein [Aeromonas veronii]|uniref:hypothetical protein n=1 Tax=Aeromonas veronii TaxID=654 RepID=UPI003F7B32E8
MDKKVEGAEGCMRTPSQYSGDAVYIRGPQGEGFNIFHVMAFSPLLTQKIVKKRNPLLNLNIPADSSLANKAALNFGGSELNSQLIEFGIGHNVLLVVGLAL